MWTLWWVGDAGWSWWGRRWWCSIGNGGNGGSGGKRWYYLMWAHCSVSRREAGWWPLGETGPEGWLCGPEGWLCIIISVKAGVLLSCEYAARGPKNHTNAVITFKWHTGYVNQIIIATKLFEVIQILHIILYLLTSTQINVDKRWKTSRFILLQRISPTEGKAKRYLWGEGEVTEVE